MWHRKCVLHECNSSVRQLFSHIWAIYRFHHKVRFCAVPVSSPPPPQVFYRLFLFCFWLCISACDLTANIILFQARKFIVLETQNKYVYCKHLDLASRDSIRSFVKKFKECELTQLSFYHLLTFALCLMGSNWEFDWFDWMRLKSWLASLFTGKFIGI